LKRLVGVVVEQYPDSATTHHAEPARMVQPSPVGANVTEADLDFVVGEAVPGALNKERLRQPIREDGQFRRSIVGDDKVFQRVMNDEEVIPQDLPCAVLRDPASQRP